MSDIIKNWNQYIKTLKDTYADMIATCDVQIKNDSADAYDWKEMRSKLVCKLIELDLLIKT